MKNSPVKHACATACSQRLNSSPPSLHVTCFVHLMLRSSNCSMFPIFLTFNFPTFRPTQRSRFQTVQRFTFQTSNFRQVRMNVWSVSVGQTQNKDALKFENCSALRFVLKFRSGRELIFYMLYKCLRGRMWGFRILFSTCWFRHLGFGIGGSNDRFRKFGSRRLVSLHVCGVFIFLFTIDNVVTFVLIEQLYMCRIRHPNRSAGGAVVLWPHTICPD